MTTTMDKKQEQNKQYFRVTDALVYAEQMGITVTRMTMLEWCRRYELGHPLGKGRWVVDRQKLKEFLEGTATAGQRPN